jgi:hypothetical protein
MAISETFAALIQTVVWVTQSNQAPFATILGYP